MKSDPQLHHGARRIAPNSLEKVIEVFGLLSCHLTYRPVEHRWAMVGQSGLDFDIQLMEVDEVPIETKTRFNSHVAFISENPEAIILTVEEWALKNNIKFIKGGWSEKELWFDLPDLFIDFVIEVMHRSVTEN